MSDPTSHSLKGQYAGFASRLVAFLIDSALLTLVTVVSAWAAVALLDYLAIDVRNCAPLAGRYRVDYWICELFVFGAPVVSTAFVVAYDLFFWTTTGQTPGKAVMGVRVVRFDGRPMNLITSVRRLLGYVLSFSLFGIGFLVILGDDRRRGWPDRLAGTCVIYAWEARESERRHERVREIAGRPGTQPRSRDRLSGGAAGE